MTQKNNLPRRIDRPALVKRMLIGAGIALTLIIIFISGVQHPSPDWGKFWMVRPLIIVTLAGATGGLCSYFITRLLDRNIWQKIIGYILSLIVFVIGLWMGTVLGLVGTLWD